MSVSAPTGPELEILIDAYIESNGLDVPASAGVRRAARAAVLEKSAAERQALLDTAKNGKAVTLRTVMVWGVKAAILAAAYAALFYGVLVMQVSLLQYVFVVALTYVIWISFDSIRNFRRNHLIVAEQK